MRIINTAELTEKTVLNPNHTAWVYNGLDCCVTYEILEELLDQLAAEPENVRATYALAKKKQAIFFEMSLRGFAVDGEVRRKKIIEAKEILAQLEDILDQIIFGVFEMHLNWRSPKQLKEFFYGTLRCKPIKARNSKGIWAPTTNRDALEKLQNILHAEIFANLILACRDIGKQIGFLESEIDEDGRMRASFNVVGTNTGRVASSMNEFGGATNMQNVSEKLRTPFVSDNGQILINVDLEQSDSRNLGLLIFKHAPRGETFHNAKNGKTYTIDEAFASGYLDACESGDLHTTVCRMAWKNLDWPEDKADWKSIAKQIFYRDFSYRDMAKRLGHGTNFVGQPRTMAYHTKTAAGIIETFQENYFEAFPGIPWYHQFVLEELRDKSSLTTPYGRRRHFFGRWKDPKTHRDAVAYGPQSMTAHSIDMAMFQLYDSGLPVQLLNQVHDSITFQIPFSEIDWLLPKCLEIMQYYITVHGRKFTVPLEAQVGWNWGKYSEDNPLGLKLWEGKEDRSPPLYRVKKKLSLRNL